MAQVVEPFEGHAAGHRSVPDDGDQPAIGAAAAGYRGGQAVGVAEDGRSVTVFHPVVHRLGPGRITGQPTGLAQGGEHLPPSGDDLVDIGLVAGVPEENVAGRGEDAVQGQGQLHGAQVGAEMAAGRRHGLDDEAANLLGQGGQLVGIQLAEVGWGVDRLQQHPSQAISCPGGHRTTGTSQWSRPVANAASSPRARRASGSTGRAAGRVVGCRGQALDGGFHLRPGAAGLDHRL